MIPTINRDETGARLAILFSKNGLSVKQVQEYLGLSCVQSVYHWLEGKSVPSIDNLYVLSELLNTPIDEIVVGNRVVSFFSFYEYRLQRLYAYYRRLCPRNAV